MDGQQDRWTFGFHIHPLPWKAGIEKVKNKITKLKKTTTTNSISLLDTCMCNSYLTWLDYVSAIISTKFQSYCKIKYRWSNCREKVRFIYMYIISKYKYKYVQPFRSNIKIIFDCKEMQMTTLWRECQISPYLYRWI